MDYDHDVYDDVLKENPRSWCRAFYRWRSCCEDVENNKTESFNNMILNDTEKPLVPMRNIIARQAMVRIMKRKTIAESHGGRCTPYVVAYLNNIHHEATTCSVYRSTNNMFQVFSGACSYRVNVNGKSCSCRRWDITGISCCHVYAIIMRQKLDVEDFVAHCFNIEKWRQTYATSISPMRGVSLWSTAFDNRLQMPPNPAQPGRLKMSKKDKKRKKAKNESPNHNSRFMHCGFCGAPNHNSRFHKDPSQKKFAGPESQPSQD